MVWLYAVLALSVLIIIHEAGHYLAAKATGMHVDVFSIVGIGPVVLKLFTWKGTDFVISAIPFGAYVHIVGMEPEEDETDPNLSEEEKAAIREEREAAAAQAREMGYENYRNRPLWARALVLAGGPIANYLAAIALAILVFLTFGMPTKAAIISFGDDSPAEKAGIKVGDMLESIAGQSVEGDKPSELVNGATSAHLGETVDVVVTRDGEELTLPVTLNDGAPALNVQLGAQLAGEASFAEAVRAGATYPFTMTQLQLAGLAKLVTWQSDQRVGGPVKIVEQMRKSADLGLGAFLLFSALISTLLGLFNLLPVPALDGGRLVFRLWEGIVRKPVNPAVEESVHGWGIMALFAILAWATFGDIKDLVKGSQGADEAPVESKAEPAVAEPAVD